MNNSISKELMSKKKKKRMGEEKRIFTRNTFQFINFPFMKQENDTAIDKAE